MPSREQLSFPAECLTPLFSAGKQQLSPDHNEIVRQVAELASLNDEFCDVITTDSILSAQM
jgi:hypothetical protein